jgi:hypothetical protein
VEQGRSDSGAGVPRRDFLRAAGAVAGGSRSVGAAPSARSRRAGSPGSASPQGRLLDTQPSDCPIDTVVVLMMENRSFRPLPRLARGDEHYLERGFDVYDIEIGPYRAACPPNEPTAAPPSPSGEHPDPFLVDQALEEKLGHEYPLARYHPWLDAPP